MMVDATGRSCSARCRAVGSENSAGEDEGGAWLQSCTSALRMRALATFVEDSAPGTWRALHGKWHRVDWIAKPQTELQYVQEAKVMQQISLNLGDHVSHLSVIMKLAMPQGVWTPQERESLLRFSSLFCAHTAHGEKGQHQLITCGKRERERAAAPLVQKWCLVDEGHEALAKYSRMTWAAAAPLCRLLRRKRPGSHMSAGRRSGTVLFSERVSCPAGSCRWQTAAMAFAAWRGSHEL